MKIISASRLAEAAPYRDLVEALRQGFRDDIETPVRHQYRTSDVAILLLMPAWSKDFTGLKTVVFKSDNSELGLPTITANYLLIDNRTGATVAIMDGTELTRRRTAAASALAADYLARKDASSMLMVGTGALGTHFVRAHAAMRPIKTVQLYNRSPDKAKNLKAELARDGFEVSVVSDLEKAMAAADIISCATTSTEPILRGKWLRPGTHVDLVGAFKPQMRETDGDVIARACVYVDTREGAEAEAGDLLQAAQEGKFRMENIQGDLFQLCRGETAGRRNSEEITLFKSCGTAIEDLAAATLVYSRS
jgi:ornithine cyclodeaminase/alanine dehydrogenase-like protein (mu-crystallin family)